MCHIVAKSAYKSLEERLNRFPLGAAPSKTLYKILEMKSVYLDRLLAKKSDIY